jgi:hypothetical protein
MGVMMNVSVCTIVGTRWCVTYVVVQTTLQAVINRVNAGLEVLRKKDEVFVNLTIYNRVDGISWLNQVPVAFPKLVPAVDCL